MSLPFHESIINAVREARDTVSMTALVNLTLKTRIPKDHAMIRNNFCKKLQELGFDQSQPKLWEAVRDHITAEQERAEGSNATDSDQTPSLEDIEAGR